MAKLADIAKGEAKDLATVMDFEDINKPLMNSMESFTDRLVKEVASGDSTTLTGAVTAAFQSLNAGGVAVLLEHFNTEVFFMSALNQAVNTRSILRAGFEATRLSRALESMATDSGVEATVFEMKLEDLPEDIRKEVASHGDDPQKMPPELVTRLKEFAKSKGNVRRII